MWAWAMPPPPPPPGCSQPNVEPAGGHRASLEQYLHIQPSASFRVDTFGFGFDLDSRLLHEIGEVTGGTYTYIPDSSFVGTAFVNSIANIRTTLRNGVELIVKPRGGAIIDKVYGYGEVDAACSLQVGAAAAAATRPGERTVRLGPVLSGQDRSIVLAVTAPAGYSDTAELLTVTMPMLNAPGERSATVSSCAVATAGANPLGTFHDCLRLHLSLYVSLYMSLALCLALNISHAVSLTLTLCLSLSLCLCLSLARYVSHSHSLYVPAHHRMCGRCERVVLIG